MSACTVSVTLPMSDMTYLLRRGKGALRRKVHLAKFVNGEYVGAWCGRMDFDLSSNVPWGRPLCKDCARDYAKWCP